MKFRKEYISSIKLMKKKKEQKINKKSSKNLFNSTKFKIDYSTAIISLQTSFGVTLVWFLQTAKHSVKII